MPSKIDYTNKRFGSWVVKSKTQKGKVEVECDCGYQGERSIYTLLNDKSTNCGCVQNEKVKKRMTTHGLSNTKLHGVWGTMKNRCNNPNVKSYKDYGGRGIKVCKEWEEDFSSFYKWAISNGYAEGLEIDRIDNDGNYIPSNCQWITKTENINDTRRTVKMTINNVTKTAAEWSKETGISRALLLDRYRKGWRGVDLLMDVQIDGNQTTIHEDESWDKEKVWAPIGMTCTNTSGHVGVHWHKKYQKWQSSITIKGKVMYLGLHIRKEDAIKARKDAEEKYPEYFNKI